MCVVVEEWGRGNKGEINSHRPAMQSWIPSLSANCDTQNMYRTTFRIYISTPGSWNELVECNNQFHQDIYLDKILELTTNRHNNHLIVALEV
jgi:hypothetical protein